MTLHHQRPFSLAVEKVRGLQRLFFVKNIIKLGKVAVSSALPLEFTHRASLSFLRPIMHYHTKLQRSGQSAAQLYRWNHLKFGCNLQFSISW